MPESDEDTPAHLASDTIQRPLLARHWTLLCAQHSFLARLSPDETQRLWELGDEFIAGKQINAAAEHELSDEMIASIAVQACLPVLELGLQAYPDFDEIIIYPGEFIVERDIVDETGIVHHSREPLAGEAWDGGPVVLSWADASGNAGSSDHGPVSALLPGNVVIHEFAHKLDMSNGAVDGLPRFYRSLHQGLETRQWCTAFEAALNDFNRRLEHLENHFPPNLDPDSEEGQRLYASLPLDPYAAENEGEFFSVCVEVFFTDPGRLANAYPEVYDLLRRYFRQDPRARLTSANARSG